MRHYRYELIMAKPQHTRDFGKKKKNENNSNNVTA